MVSERPFLDPGRRPEPEELVEVLGDATPFWFRLLGIAAGFRVEWGFTGTGGWMLKVFDRTKALLYLVPLLGAFKVSLTIRETERAAFLEDESLALPRNQIRGAKRYPEGYALYFEVAGGTDIRPLETLIGKLVAVRKLGN